MDGAAAEAETTPLARDGRPARDPGRVIGMTLTERGPVTPAAGGSVVGDPAPPTIADLAAAFRYLATGHDGHPPLAAWNDQETTETGSEDDRALRQETEQVVNETAQGLRTLDEGTTWFSGLPLADRQEVLREVGRYAMQTHITVADGRAGVARSGVKPTANPSVMICMDPPRTGFAGLPADEHVKAFRVLVAVFAVADTRRRETYCKGTCGRSWHHLSTAADQP
ncbi:DUF5958 family protein [Streptomyces sp. NPDC059247]|uniref:DUF5958 family protein n=1 Tax=Streptomyces sp. NPDC059247 TaxID=3346790 RepID=UPI0036B0B202